MSIRCPVLSQCHGWLLTPGMERLVSQWSLTMVSQCS